MIAIVVSAKDIAGMGIKAALLSRHGFCPSGEHFDGEEVFANGIFRLFTIQERPIYAEGVDERLNADLIIFATTHRSESGKPSLSLHAPGNWGLAELGGETAKLCIAPALHMKSTFALLSKLGNGSGYEITLEVTHHGPWLSRTPCFFIEIGSSDREWGDKRAAGIIAETIVTALSNESENSRVALGLGGGHYAPYFNKLQLSSGFAIGHICPKHALENLTPELIKTAMERTHPRAEVILYDEKGMGGRKQEILGWIKALGIPVIGCRKIKIG